MQAWEFMFQFFRNPVATGAVAPSSTRLAEVITDAADLGPARTVIEFGCGTGVFTEKIASKLASGAVFLAIDINPDFVEATRRRCPGIQVLQDSAVNARSHLERLGRTRCDRIICGLPWAAFPETLQQELLATILDILDEGGLFLTFAYLQGLLLPAGRRFRHKLEAAFTEVTTSPTVWSNLPPAFVYCARKGRGMAGRGISA